MSQGNTCNCAESKKPMGERAWHVIARLCNHSAFNGYRETRSEYSAVRCRVCSATWRTKAKFVSRLPDAPADWASKD